MTIQEVILQEEKLQFDTFKNSDAWNIASLLLTKVTQNNLGSIRIRIIYDKTVILHYLMDGKSESEWPQRKENTVMDSGHCSLYTYLLKDAYKQWGNNDNYAICGGGFPILENNQVKGAICVSGLDHVKDHQLIVEVLEDYLQSH